MDHNPNLGVLKTGICSQIVVVLSYHLVEIDGLITLSILLYCLTTNCASSPQVSQRVVQTLLGVTWSVEEHLSCILPFRVKGSVGDDLALTLESSSTLQWRRMLVACYPPEERRGQDGTYHPPSHPTMQSSRQGRMRPITHPHILLYTNQRRMRI